MRIKDRPEFNRKAPLLTFRPDDTVRDAVRVMSEKNYGAAVIVDEQEKPLGIVTERDFMRRLLDKELDPASTRLRDIMTTNLKLARAEDDLLEWMQQMSNDRFRRLPVVDEQGKLVALMTQGDFVAYTWPQLMGRVTEQARATFDRNPSLIMAGVGIVAFMVSATLMFWTIARLA
jgi:CBS-domain-containing membrane protein